MKAVVRNEQKPEGGQGKDGAGTEARDASTVDDEVDKQSDTPKTSGRQGVREGFGEHEMALVAEKLRSARRSSGIKVTGLFKSMDDEKIETWFLSFCFNGTILAI
mgnify:CR=1 FL=1